MENKVVRYFVIRNRIEEIPVLAEKIEKLAGEWNFPPALTMNLNLVVEEAVSNIIFYAFEDNAEHLIRISFLFSSPHLTIRILDDGKAFDPSSRFQPDISSSAPDRPVGGLGIFLITKMMDSVQYTRKKNRNVLILKKEINYEVKKRENP